MKRILSEKNLVIVLFVMVLITFSLAQEDTRKMEKAYTGFNATASSFFVTLQSQELKSESAFPDHLSTPELAK